MAYLAGPALFILAGAIVLVPISLRLRVPAIGPFDETVVWWAILLPVACLVPWAVALAEPLAGRAARRRITAVLATVLGLGVAVPLLTSGASVGCDPDPGLGAILPRVAIVAVALAGGFALTVRATASRIDRAVVAIPVAAVGTVLTVFGSILVFAAVFVVGVSCAWVPS